MNTLSDNISLLTRRRPSRIFRVHHS